MPISFVRSVTVTSMMFITPMPPTSRPIELSTTITSAVIAVTLRNSSIICSAVEIQKLSGSLYFTRRSGAQHPRTSSIACGSMPPCAVTTSMCSRAFGNIFRIVK